METNITEYEQSAYGIPEFVVKLYHILEVGNSIAQSKQYTDYISWGRDNQIIIKNGKKLEEKVLLNYFRHRNLSSFIRQLNMYKFNKVNKVVKEKNYMYFTHPHFKKGNIPDMQNIKRNNKKNRQLNGSKEVFAGQSEIDQSDAISINKDLQNNQYLESYKIHVKNSIKEILEAVKKVEQTYPQTKQQLSVIHNACSELLQTHENTTFSNEFFEQNNQNKNMLSTMRLVPRIESLIFPSQCSLIHFN